MGEVQLLAKDIVQLGILTLIGAVFIWEKIASVKNQREAASAEALRATGQAEAMEAERALMIRRILEPLPADARLAEILGSPNPLGELSLPEIGVRVLAVERNLTGVFTHVAVMDESIATLALHLAAVRTQLEELEAIVAQKQDAADGGGP